QSMIDNELKKIGRRHTSEEAANAVRLLKKYFDNVSIDVMFGLPGQDRCSYRKTLEEIISLQPQHISSYSLMLEDGTAMTNLVGRGVVNLPDEEEWLALFEMNKQSLNEAGYEHYEISNYAKPGFESRHNSAYWLGLPYLGLGPGAHSYDGERIRRANPADLKGYLKYYSGRPASKEDGSERYFFIEEYLSNEELAEEMIMTRLRMKSGLNLDEFSDKFGNQQAVRLKEKAENFIKRGELAMSGESLHLTKKGILLSDYILSSLI
ncbi:MAG: coproporphyrinogen III oxidase, partial [Muribaculaceae bacterium]|nr:coproporphyrinogen III oxidase [Muribaculaceae bacterium]